MQISDRVFVDFGDGWPIGAGMTCKEAGIMGSGGKYTTWQSGTDFMEEAEYEVKAKVLKGITRLGIQPQNTEYLSFTRKLSDIIDKTGW